MKKILTAAICLLVLFSLSACVPTEQDSIQVGPDLTPNANVEYDFTQLHNNTVEFFEGHDEYMFITDLDITGSNEDRMIYVKAVCVDDANEETAQAFLSAVMRYINDSANIQDMTVECSDSAGFGSFWNKFGIRADVYTETEAAKENGTPVYTLELTPGETVPLDPDIESYEEEWQRQMEILRRNEE